MTSVIITRTAEHKGAHRIWVEGRKLEREGFGAGDRYEVVQEHSDRLILRKCEEGARTVSRRTKKGHIFPVIDLNAKSLARWFDLNELVRVAIRRGKIVIKKHHSSTKIDERLRRIRQKLRNNEKLACTSLFHGGGVLDAALHSGLARAGVGSFVQTAVECDPRYLEASMEVNSHLFTDETHFIEAGVENVCLDNPLKTELFYAGIPCTGASLSGRSKNKLAFAEAHESAGALFFSTLSFIEATQPAIVLLENVKQYQSTASMAVIRSVLNTMGYDIQERILNGVEFGALENRDRLCVVATTKGLESVIDLDALAPKTAGAPRCINDVLEPIGPDSDLWRNYDYLDKKQARDKASGKGFMRQTLSGEEPHCGVIGREYAKVRSTEPQLAHPSDETLTRLFTPIEHARVKGIPEAMVAPEWISKTLAHEILGQSVIFVLFERVGEALGQGLATIRAADEPLEAVELGVAA